MASNNNNYNKNPTFLIDNFDVVYFILFSIKFNQNNFFFN